MPLFHRHEWTEVKRTFTPPDNTITEMEHATPTFLNRLLYGFTTIELRCECGDVAFRTATGDQR